LLVATKLLTAKLHSHYVKESEILAKVRAGKVGIGIRHLPLNLQPLCQKTRCAQFHDSSGQKTT